MKRTFLLLVAGLLATVFSYAQVEIPELEQKDDPAARAAYWFNKLKDPATGQIPANIREKELLFVNSPQARLVDYTKQAKNTWLARGPWNVGGRTRALAIDLENSNRILAAGVSGGVWISNDGGQSWTKATIPQDVDNSPAVTAIAQDPSNTKVWYYAGGEYLGNSTSGGYASYRGTGIFKSTDGGNTWVQVRSAGDVTRFDSYFDYVWNLAVTSNGTLLAATYGGVERSTDGGVTFDYVLDSDPNNTYNFASYSDVVVAPNGTIYGALSSNGDKHGIFKSTDDGQTWVDITPTATGFNQNYNRLVLAVAPSAPDTLYVLGITGDQDADGNTIHLLWMYDNNTGTWQDRSANLPKTNGLTGTFDSQGGYDLVIAVKPDDPDVVYAGGVNLYFSLNGFADTNLTFWAGGYTPADNSYAKYSNHHPDQHSLAFDPSNPLKLYSGHDGGLSVTTNCIDTVKNNDLETVDWVSLNNGYLTTQAYTVAIDPSGTQPNDVIAGFQDNGTWYTSTTNLTDEWAELFSGDGSYCAIADNGKTQYVSSQNGTTYAIFYDDLGDFDGFTKVNPNLSSPLFINPFVVSPSDTVMYMLDDDHIWRHNTLHSLRNNLYSYDAPAGWEILSNSYLSSGYYTTLAISANNTLYAGTNEGKIYKFTNAHTGQPVATEITGANFPTADYGPYVSSIAIDPTDDNKVLIAFSNYGVLSIFYTQDGGKTWTNVSGNLEENPDGSGSGPSVRWVNILPLGGQDTVYLAGTSTGLYATTSLSGSVTWTQQATTTIGNAVVDMVVSRPSDGLVVAGTHANGVYSTVYETSTTTTNTPVVTVEKLDVYPNPGKDMFMVKLPETGGRLVIYNTNGQVVYNSVPSSLQHVMDLTPLRAGNYFVNYYTENKIYSQKLVIVK